MRADPIVPFATYIPDRARFSRREVYRAPVTIVTKWFSIVSLRRSTGGGRAVRDSKDPTGPVLVVGGPHSRLASAAESSTDPDRQDGPTGTSAAEPFVGAVSTPVTSRG
jgi:hypothetical protein